MTKEEAVRRMKRKAWRKCDQMIQAICKLFGHVRVRSVEVKDRVEWPLDMETTQDNIDNLAFPNPNGCCTRYRTYRRCLCGEHQQQVDLHFEEA